MSSLATAGPARSRERLGVKLVGSTYSERWLVVDAIVKSRQSGEITFTLRSAPAPGRAARGRRAGAVGVHAAARRERGDAEARRDDSRACRGDGRRRAFEIERKAVYAFHARVAEHWRRGRVFLAGDAAHLMPPFAGQGMNGGMKDASNLAWKLAAVLRGLAPDAILDTYEVERAPVVRKMVEVSRRLGAVIMPTNRDRRRGARLRFRLPQSVAPLPRLYRPRRRRAAAAIHRSALTTRDRDAADRADGAAAEGLIGRGALRRSIASSAAINGLSSALALIPRSMVSTRDRAILEALGASFVCLGGPAR